MPGCATNARGMIKKGWSGVTHATVSASVCPAYNDGILICQKMNLLQNAPIVARTVIASCAYGCEELKSLQKRKFLKKIESVMLVMLFACCFPVSQKLQQEQMEEKELEAKVKSVPLNEMKVQEAECALDERLYCNRCNTSIVDFHQSCKCCSYDLCLSRCCEIRSGKIPGGEDIKVVLNDEDRGRDYIFGLKYEPQETKPCNDMDLTEAPNNPFLLWKANRDGSIPCPPKELGGCGGSVLDLKCLLSDWMLPELEKRADRVVRSEIYAKAMPKRRYQCPCYDHSERVKIQNVRKAENRKGLSDNNLYCPVATGIKEDDLAHFQIHWAKGEPVIVSDVLKLTSV